MQYGTARGYSWATVHLFSFLDSKFGVERVDFSTPFRPHLLVCHLSAASPIS